MSNKMHFCLWDHFWNNINGFMKCLRFMLKKLFLWLINKYLAKPKYLWAPKPVWDFRKALRGPARLLEASDRLPEPCLRLQKGSYRPRQALRGLRLPLRGLRESFRGLIQPLRQDLRSLIWALQGKMLAYLELSEKLSVSERFLEASDATNRLFKFHRSSAAP